MANVTFNIPGLHYTSSHSFGNQWNVKFDLYFDATIVADPDNQAAGGTIIVNPAANGWVQTQTATNSANVAPGNFNDSFALVDYIPGDSGSVWQQHPPDFNIQPWNWDTALSFWQNHIPPTQTLYGLGYHWNYDPNSPGVGGFTDYSFPLSFPLTQQQIWDEQPIYLFDALLYSWQNNGTPNDISDDYQDISYTNLFQISIVLPTYDVTYNDGDGNTISGPTTYQFAQNSTVNPAITDPSGQERPFLGWQSSQGGTVNPGTIYYGENGSVVYTAEWGAAAKYYVPGAIRSGGWNTLSPNGYFAVNDNNHGFFHQREGGAWVGTGISDKDTERAANTGPVRVRSSGTWLQAPMM